MFKYIFGAALLGLCLYGVYACIAVGGIVPVLLFLIWKNMPQEEK